MFQKQNATIQVRPRSGNNGFTLIQLLIVIAVVAVLAVLTIAASRSAIENSRRVACVAKVRTFGAAITMYAADHRGRWPYYIRDHPGGGAPLDTWTTSAARNYGDWLALGLVFPYVGDQSNYLCPADMTHVRDYQKFDWKTYPNNLWGSYQMRGFRQTYHPSQGRLWTSPLGDMLADMTNRSLVSCFFSYNPSNPKLFPLSHHNYSYPVLFGNGRVELKPLPTFIDRRSPPDIWSTTSLQIQMWDSFDGF